jgi:hypothetical protein
MYVFLLGIVAAWAYIRLGSYINPITGEREWWL